MKWAAIAAKYDVRLCTGCPAGDHNKGWARGGLVHWSDRIVTHAGIRNFLMLVASQRLLGFEDMPTWQRIYSKNVWAYNAARELHYRLPVRMSESDRAHVRWLIRNKDVPHDVRRWANRGNK